MIIEIATHGAALRRRRERFIVQAPDQKDVEVPAEKTSAILISSNAMISTSAIKLCIERQIQLVITSWYGKPVARMWSSTPGRQTQIRRQQYLNQDTEFAFNVTKKLLLEKLSKQKRLLGELKQNRTQEDIISDIAETISFMNQTINNVKEISYQMDFAQHFLGFEGSCALRYFKSVSACLPKKWQFERRSQNPGIDPFNASLNYMYGIAYSSIEKIVILSGLDPTAGFYHKDHYAKPTLVFDLIEPQRPIIDKALLYLFNKRIVRDSWFAAYTDNPAFGVELNKAGRGSLIATYRENCSKAIEKSVWQQCRQLNRELLEMDRFGGAQ